MSVVTSIENTGPCSKKLTIEVPAEAVEAEMGRVVGKFRKSLRLPGFRRGKVPVSMVHKRFREEIRQEVLDRLLPRYWHQAQAEKDLDPMLPPKVEELELEPGQPMTVVASVDTRPEIELRDFRNFDLPAEDTEPDAGEIEDAVTEVRRQHAEWRAVERPAARGDLVLARIVDAGAEAPAGNPISIEVGGDNVDEELTLTLTGMSAGGSAEYGPDDKPRQIEVVEVKEQELPELDDAFAGRLGLESPEELRQAVENDLRRSKERHLRQRREQSMLEQLRQRHPLELPSRVVDKESESMLQDYAEQLHAQGVDLDQAEIDWASLGDQLRPGAERRVHEQLLLDAVAKAEDIRLDENEFERFLSAAAAQQKQSSLMLRQQLSENGRLEPLRAQMLRAQTVRFLLGDSATEGDAAGDSASSDGGPDDTASSAPASSAPASSAPASSASASSDSASSAPASSDSASSDSASSDVAASSDGVDND